MMSNMKLFRSNGFLSEFGEQSFQDYLDQRIHFLLTNGAESESEIRLIGSLIMNRVGNIVADHVAALKNKKE
jgi:hypothetical protein